MAVDCACAAPGPTSEATPTSSAPTLALPARWIYRGERYALRWLSRYLAERPVATLDDVTIVVTCLRVLGGPAHAEALSALRSAVSA